MIHRYWHGDGLVTPEDFYDDEYRWSDRDIPPELEEWISARHGVVPLDDLGRHRANFVRWWLMWEHGGVWLDYDITIVDTLPPAPWVSSWDGNPEPGALCFEPHHPLIGEILTFLNRPYSDPPTVASRAFFSRPPNASGANVLRRSFRQHPVPMIPLEAGSPLHME